MSVDDLFLDWVKRTESDVEHVANLLREKLSDEPENLVSDLQEIEAWNARVGFLLAEANSWVTSFSLIYLPERSLGNEFERKIILGEKIRGIKTERDKIEWLCEAIKQRLILGASILKYYQQFKEHKAKIPAGEIY